MREESICRQLLRNALEFVFWDTKRQNKEDYAKRKNKQLTMYDRKFLSAVKGDSTWTNKKSQL